MHAPVITAPSPPPPSPSLSATSRDRGALARARPLASAAVDLLFRTKGCSSRSLPRLGDGPANARDRGGADSVTRCSALTAPKPRPAVSSHPRSPLPYARSADGPVVPASSRDGDICAPLRDASSTQGIAGRGRSAHNALPTNQPAKAFTYLSFGIVWACLYSIRSQAGGQI